MAYESARLDLDQKTKQNDFTWISGLNKSTSKEKAHASKAETEAVRDNMEEMLNQLNGI